MVNILHCKLELKLIIRIDKKTCESRAMKSLSHQGTPTPGVSNEATIEDLGTPAERQQDGGSEYAMRRDANIAENKRLLASLGLSEGGSSAIRDKSVTKKGKGKGKEKEKEKG